MDENGAHPILIIRCGHRCFLEPGHRVVKPGEKVTFEVLGTGRATLFFPEIIVAEAGSSASQEPYQAQQSEGGRHEAREGQPVTLRVLEGVPPGAYPFAVFCHETCDFATGGSHPLMIVRSR